MPVDKFGHTDSGSMQRVVAGGVTLTQVNNTFLRLDGTNALTGNLNLGGNTIVGLSTAYTPSEDNDLTNKKYVDQHATRDYVSGMKVSPGNLVRNTRSGIIYRFGGTAGPITVAPALSPNWKPTTGVAICVLREAPEGQQIPANARHSDDTTMLDRLTTIARNTDSAYTTTNRGIIVPRTGVYRLGGYVNSTNIEASTPAGSFIQARYVQTTGNQSVVLTYGAWNNTSGVLRDTDGILNHLTTILPSPILHLRAGDRLGIAITTNASCSTAASG